MSQYITRDDLLSLGIDEVQLDDQLAKLNQEAELRIGDEIIDSLNDKDTQTLVDLQDTASDDELAAWIVERVPDYQDIVRDTIDIILGDFAKTLTAASL